MRLVLATLALLVATSAGTDPGAAQTPEQRRALAHALRFRDLHAITRQNALLARDSRLVILCGMRDRGWEERIGRALVRIRLDAASRYADLFDGGELVVRGYVSGAEIGASLGAEEEIRVHGNVACQRLLDSLDSRALPHLDAIAGTSGP